MPSAPPTWTGRATAVIDAGSTTQTELPPWCSFSADSGTRATPASRGAAIATVAVWPSRGAVAALPRSALTRKVRVTGSAAAEISRIVAATSLPLLLQRRTCTGAWRAATAWTSATLSSGTEKTTSRGPSCARRSTGAPAATTMPGSTSTPVITPPASAVSAA